MCSSDLAAVAVAVALVLAAPVIGGASQFVTIATAVLANNQELGDLAAPLSLLHIFGIWPSGDFRYSVETDKGLALILLFVAVIAAVVGLVWMIRRRSVAPLILLGGNTIAAAYLLSRASPYAASKVMMILTTGVVTSSMLGAVALHDTGRRALGWGLATILAAGVLWTNLLAYHDSAVLPQGRFHELAQIGHRFAGHGPAFYDLWDTVAVYFLREESVSAPNTFAGPAELSAGQEPRSPNQLVAPWDPNILAPSYLQRFPLLVLDRSPLLSRPPANYTLAYQGRYYDVWQRQPRPVVLEQIPFDNGGPSPLASAPCPTIMRTAARARRLGARLVFVRHPALPTLIPTRAKHTPAWSAHRAQGETERNFLFLGQASGSVAGTVHVASPGRYRVWLQGSLSRPVDVSVGGQAVGSLSAQIGNAGQFNQLGSLELAAGDVPVRIDRPGSGLGPGNVASGELLGPLVLVKGTATPVVEREPPSRARGLCGQPLEWLEVVR